MKKLRFIAALFVLTSAAFLPFLLFPTPALAAYASTTVTCANAQGEPRSAQIAWDNSQTFFQDKGYIPRFYCEGGYAGAYSTYVSDTLNNSPLGYYNGVVINPSPSPSPTPTDGATATASPSPSPSESPTATATPSPSASETPTASPSPSPESSTTQTPTPTPTPTPTQSQPSGPTFPDNSVYGTANEGSDLTLMAPAGYVFIDVYFASYGTPLEYSIDQSCHSITSVSVVAGLALGNNSVTIPADNGLFGDPCGGTYKWLSVILTYGVGSSPTPAPSETATATPEPSPSSSAVPSPEPTPQPSPSETPTPSPTQTPTPNPSDTPSVLNAPQNLVVDWVNDNDIKVSWSAPTDGGIPVERYAIFFSYDNWQTGYAIASTTCDAIIYDAPYGSSVSIKIRSDNDTLAVYSIWSNEVVAVISAPTPTPTPTPDPVVVPPEPTPTPTPQPSPQPTPDPEPSPEPTPEPTVSPDPEVTPEPSPTPSPEETPTPEPSPTPEPEPSSSAEPEPTPTPTDNAPEPPIVEEEPTVAEAIADALADGKLTEEEKTVVAEALVASLAPGEALTAAEIKEAGISYADLPPETPVEVRTDANGNEVVITAEVAANVELVTDPAAFATELFSDPAAAFAALGSIGADMSPEEREQSQKAVVATVVAAGAALNAVGAAAATSTSPSARRNS